MASWPVSGPGSDAVDTTPHDERLASAGERAEQALVLAREARAALAPGELNVVPIGPNALQTGAATRVGVCGRVVGPMRGAAFAEARGSVSHPWLAEPSR